MEIVTSLISPIVEPLLKGTIHELKYSFRFNKYVEEFVNKKQKLSDEIKKVKDRDKKATEEAQKIDITVEEWLKEAHTLIDHATSLEEEANTNNKCCVGYFPDLIARRRLSKQLEEKTNEMADVISKCNFEQFARPATPPSILSYYASKGFMLFDSIKSSHDELVKALKDEGVWRIGLYGMGGCGKTTLAKQVGEAVTKDFDKVLFVAVSSSVDIGKIQDSIASQLEFKLEEKWEASERARHLWKRLTSGQKILIILDDVWDEKLAFKDIGIPDDDEYKKCNVLLTTRKLHVCKSMGCHQTIPLSLLSEEEGWRLFQHYAGINNDESTDDKLKQLARKIAHECKRLAVAITTVARSLKGKIMAEWEEALETLTDSGSMHIDEGAGDVYRCLKLSYDNLKDEEAKSVFLLCCVYPEDYEIDEEDLVRYGFGLGLFQKVNSFKRARNRVSIAKEKLIESCLLIRSDGNEKCVKMHDLVRDAGLRIAKDEKFEILGPESSGKVLKGDGSMNENSIRYMWLELDSMDSFPVDIHFPKLVFLCVWLKKRCRLMGQCFKGMGELRVLVLQYRGWFEDMQFPLTVLESLSNIHCLYLERWDLSDISFLGSLKRLQSLALRDCIVHELPVGIIELESFRSLDVRECQIEENPYEVIGGCSDLEELYFLKNEIHQWKDEKQHAIDHIFGKKEVAPKLQRYCVEIGRHFYWEMLDDFRRGSRSMSRGICVEHFDVSNAKNPTVTDLVERAEFLYLKTFYGGCRNIIPEMFQRLQGMNKLTTLMLDDSQELEFIVDTTNIHHGSIQVQNFFFKLIELQLRDLKSLKNLFGGTFPNAHQILNMCNLKVLKLYECPLLTHVFTLSMAKSFLVSSKEVSIGRCEGLQCVIKEERAVEEENRSGDLLEIQLPNLKRLYLWVLPNLITICPKLYCLTLCPNLEHLSLQSLKIRSIIDLFFNPATLQKLSSVASHGTHLENEATILSSLQKLMGSLSQLKHLSIFDCDKLEKIAEDEQSLLEGFKHLGSFNLCNVQLIQIFGCSMLKWLFTVSTAASLTSLLYLHIKGCEELQYVMKEKRVVEEANKSSGVALPIIQLPNLKRLYLWGLSNLITISPQFFCFPNLEYLTLSQLNLKSIIDLFIDPATLKKLKSLANHDVFQALQTLLESLSQLKELGIRQCDKMEQIIDNGELFDSLKMTVNSYTPPPQHPSRRIGSFNLCNVQKITIIDCSMLKWLFTVSTATSLTSLHILWIESCEELEYVIKDETVEEKQSNDNRNEELALLPNLKFVWLSNLPNLIQVYHGWKRTPEDYIVYCPKLIQTSAPPSTFEENIESKMESNGEMKEEHMIEEEKAVEENKLVPYNPIKAGKQISLEMINDNEAGPSEAKYGDDVPIPGLPLWPSISIPFEAQPTNSSSI